jgi:hypothetical protein
MGSLLPPSAASSARSTAATAAASERPLLGSRAALRTALPELPCLSPAVHIAKRASRTLRACDPLAAGCRPLGASDPRGATSRPLSGGGSARPACSTYTTHATRTIWASHTSHATNSTGTAQASRTSDTTHAARTSRAAYATPTAGPSWTSYATHTARAAGPSRSPAATCTGRGPYSAARYGHLRTAGQPRRSAGRAGKVGGPPTRVVRAPTGRGNLRPVHVDIVVAIDIDVGITAAPCGARPPP